MRENWLLYASVFSQFILVVLGALVSLIEVESKRYKIAMILLFALVGFIGMVTGVSQYSESKKENIILLEKLSKVDSGIGELKLLTKARPGDTAEMVLSSAANKIKELDIKTKQLEIGVKDITSLRHLTENQKKLISKELSDYCSEAKQINISLIWQNDGEAIGYANDFYQVLTSIKCWHGYRSVIGEQYKPAVFPSGVSIIVKDINNLSKDATALIKALRVAKVSHNVVVSSSITDPVILFVGYKR